MYTAGVDYMTTMVTLIFQQLVGGGTERQFSVPIFNDLLPEGPETFGLSASIVNNLGVFTDGRDMANGTIVDDEGESSCLISGRNRYHDRW